VDNWYSSPDLFVWLHNRATNACGTVRKNRKQMPKFEYRLKTEEICYKSDNVLLALKWKDKRDVHMLTTCHTAELIETAKKNRKTGENKVKPKCVTYYSKNMGAVDRADMLLSSVQSIRKTMKWYKKLFFHFLDMAVLNAHFLQSAVTGKKTPLAEFQLNLISEILEREK
jgi:hypothetical protein